MNGTPHNPMMRKSFPISQQLQLICRVIYRFHWSLRNLVGRGQYLSEAAHKRKSDIISLKLKWVFLCIIQLIFE